MFYCQDCINSANCYSLSEDGKLMAVIQTIKDKFYLEIFNIKDLQSVTYFELKMRNPHRVEWGQNNMYLMVSEQFFENKVCFYLLNGTLIQQYDKTNLQFDKYHFGDLKERALFVNTLGDITLFNLKYLQPIKIINSINLLEKNQQILKEIDSVDTKQALKKRRKFTIDKFSQQKKYEHLQISILKVSVTDELFAVVFQQYPDILVIYDILNLCTKISVQFYNPIKDFEWTLQHDLIVITGDFCFYIWSNNDLDKMKIIEFFYKGEFEAKKLRCYKQSQICIFQDPKQKKLLLYQQNKGDRTPRLESYQNLKSQDNIFEATENEFEINNEKLLM